MPATFAYPTSAEIMKIDPILLAQQIADDPLIGPRGLFPIRYTDQDMLVWDQRDSYNGLMQFRGLNGQPPKVKRLNNKRFKVEPGYYGEFNEVDEAEMTRRAQPDSFSQPIKVDDLVTECHEQLMARQNNRMRWVAYQLLCTGSFVVLDKDGAIGHQDSYKIQQYAAAVPWSTSATATPVANLRQIPIFGRGQSTNFGGSAEQWMTQLTFNNFIGVTNTGDIRGERLNFGQTVKSVAQANEIMSANNLPAIRIVEDGYLDEVTGAWNTFVPDSTVLFIGKRTNGAPLGEFRMTKNIAAPDGKGVYDKIVTKGMMDNEAPPPTIEVHRGFHGGLVLYYPGSVFVLKV